MPNAQYPFRVVRILRSIWKPWRWLRTVVRIIRWGKKADVLFVNGLAMEAALANFVLRKPMVQKVVGDLAWEQATTEGWLQEGFEEFHTRRYGKRVEALKALRAWWTRQADTVIVPSRYLAGWVAKWGVSDDRIVVIYNAVEPLDGIYPAEVPLRTRVKVVTVGRLVPWKRVDQILETILSMHDVGLVVIGDGPERAKLEEKIKALDITDRVYFAGTKNKVETLALMAGCDFFVLNSSYEGFPHVVLEAMSLGLPVVATAVGGTPEIVQHEENGLLIAPKSNRGLANALLHLVSSPLKRQRLAGGAKYTVDRFRLSAMVEKTEAVLRDSSERKNS